MKNAQPRFAHEVLDGIDHIFDYVRGEYHKAHGILETAQGNWDLLKVKECIDAGTPVEGALTPATPEVSQQPPPEPVQIDGYKAIAEVWNNNQPRNDSIVMSNDGVTLPVGTILYLCPADAQGPWGDRYAPYTHVEAPAPIVEETPDVPAQNELSPKVQEANRAFEENTPPNPAVDKVDQANQAFLETPVGDKPIQGPVEENVQTPAPQGAPQAPEQDKTPPSESAPDPTPAPAG